jgi:phosphoadenosine phosphosulfate reductase
MAFNVDNKNTIILTSQVIEDKTAQFNASLEDKIADAKKALVLAADMSNKYYNEPLILTYSGGKDSDVLLHLAENCLKSDEFEVLNSHTSVDAPDTVYHIRNTFKRLNEKGIKATVHQPVDSNGNPITMWNLIPKKQIPPTRLQRYCCKVLKESSTPNRICAVGVRAAESSKRQGRDIFSLRAKNYKYFSLEHAAEVHQESQEIQDDAWDCTLIKGMKEHNDVIVNPIYYWSDEDIWKYISINNMTVNPLYAKGYKRVGRIGCPFATYHQVMREFNDFPKYKQAYINAFEKMLQVRRANGKDEPKGHWSDGKAVFDWWIEEYKHNIKGQMTMEDMLNE